MYDRELGAHHLAALEILDLKSQEVTSMVHHLEEVSHLDAEKSRHLADRVRDDWFSVGGFGKLQAYYGRFVQIHGLRDDPKPFVRGYFNTIPYALNRENLSFWEHSPNKGAWNKTHETGYFLQQTRMMMVMERGSELWLAPFVTHHWMKDGMTVSLRNAPTSFGKVSYRIISAVGRGTIEAEINPPQRSDPSLIVLRLRHPNEKRMRSVRINGRMHTDFDPQREIIRIKPGGREIRVLATY